MPTSASASRPRPPSAGQCAAAAGARCLPSPTRMSTIEGETLYRNPASHELYGDRPRIIDYFVNPGDRDELIATLRDKGRWTRSGCASTTPTARSSGPPSPARLIEFQDRQVIVSNTTNITDTILAQEADAAGQRAPGGRDRVAGRRVRALRQERLPGAGQQPLPHDARHERRRAGAGRQLVRLPARHRRAPAVSGWSPTRSTNGWRSGPATAASSASRSSGTPTAAGSSSPTARPARAASWSRGWTSPSASAPSWPPRRPTSWSARCWKPARSTSR